MAITCPQCGGEDLKLISPGFYECESFDSDAYICHHRFHAARPTMSGEQTLCSCGTFAIGICTECGQSVCGDHSRVVDSVRLCDRHAGAVQDDLLKREHEEATQRQREFESALAEAVDRFVEVMNAAGNPGCKGSYRRENRRATGYKSKSIRGWGIGREFFIKPDGSIVQPGGKRLNRSIRGSWLPHKVNVVGEWEEQVFRGSDRGSAVEAAFQSGGRGGEGSNPLRAMVGHLEDHGLAWPDGYRPPNPADFGSPHR